MTIFSVVKSFASFPGWRRLRSRLPVLGAFRQCSIGAGSGADGPISIEVRGRAEIGDRVQFHAGATVTTIRVGADASLSIGDDTVVGYGVTFAVSKQLLIGRRCVIGPFTRISDSERGRLAPITIGDGVQISHGAVIEPGVTIGDGAMIAAGSVVSCAVPSKMLAQGNPAVIVPRRAALPSE
jgi:acetyltransferase-like isoleucine patch superfamily enzyme